jgi:two-component system response regulator AtoC
MTEAIPRTLTEAWRAVERAPSRILLVEDDLDMRQLLAADLRLNGSEVVEVADGRAALDHFRRSLGAGPSSWIDVVISDFKMPKLSGLKLLAAIREECDILPFILITAFAESAVQGEARRLGVSLVLEKPFDLEALNLAVRRAA